MGGYARNIGQNSVGAGATDDAATCQTALRRWLARKGEDHLLPWLKRVSNKIGISYAAASIRQQRTRWGSCSSRCLINLNARLLFLPPNFGYLRARARVVSYQALKPFTQILAVGRVLFARLSEIESATSNGGRYIPGWLTASCGREVRH